MIGRIVYTWCEWPFMALSTVEDEAELHAEITPEARSQLNLRLRDGRSVIIGDGVKFYKC